MLKFFSAIKGAGLLWPLLAIFISMSVALAGTGWLLKNAWQKNGQLSGEITQWHAANDAWSKSWQVREAEFDAAQARMQQREADFQRIEGERNAYQEKLRAILRDSPDDNCGLRPDIWLLIKDSAAGNAAGSLSGG